MKKILGLDLGTTSIGWAVVNEAEEAYENSSIIRLGVRVNPLTVDEQRNFEQGKSITTNADRALKHGMRINLKRYKMRRAALVELLKENKFIDDDTLLSETGKATTYQTHTIRAQSATQKVSLADFARVLLMLNKKRGYKSNRKVKDAGEGQLIDGMSVARELYDNGLTPGQYAYKLLSAGKKYIPDFYRSDQVAELDRIWSFQRQFYGDILTDEFWQQIEGRSKSVVNKMFYAKYHIYTAQNTGKERQMQAYAWRSAAVDKQLPIEELAYVICDLCGEIDNASGYLGAISDRSKELYFNHQTVGQYKLSLLKENANRSLKNRVFYRQDYLDEFETVWETQAHYYPQLTRELKHVVRDIIIFYQRRLKSKKSTISTCELETRKVERIIDGKPKIVASGPKVAPKSSPVFQEFKIWQCLNNLQVSFADGSGKRFLTQEEKELLYPELSIKALLSKSDVIKLLYGKAAKYELNYKTIEGNRTQAALYEAYRRIIGLSGNGEYDFAKMSAEDIFKTVSTVFEGLGYNTGILVFDPDVESCALERQPMYRLWHLLYSYEGDTSKTGNDKLIEKLAERYGFGRECAAILAGVTFEEDYGSLSVRAMHKILPYMRDGNEYSLACEYAGYRHSKRSMTREELDKKALVDRLVLLPKNSLRNPVVEKILNQMIHVVNTAVEEYGKPDEIRIELARELKKSMQERKQLTGDIAAATRKQDDIKKILKSEFGIVSPSRNDIVRYRLYEELRSNGFKTLYTDRYIPKEKLFSKEFDIEHIIPQAKLFDDSFSNKTIESREANIEKSDMTAYDYVIQKYGEAGVDAYKARVEMLLKDGSISRAKRNKLLIIEKDIPDGFIERDLRDSQYIAKKAREILEDLVKVVVPTTGTITDRLREDWQLVDVMKELNWNKYECLGLTEIVEDKDGRKIRRIKDWTKRNDHRHHAMDALTIAFTKQSYIQYLNHLNARRDVHRKMHVVINAIEHKELYREDGKLKFQPPMPLATFRAEAKRQLENILVSIKSKNKVVTSNVNKINSKDGILRKIQLTPRGQLHNETVYGEHRRYVTKLVSVGSSFNAEGIGRVANKSYRDALLRRLNEFGGDAKKAFTGKNALDKTPLYIDDMQVYKVPSKVKIVSMESIYTIRKAVSPDLAIDKVVDVGVRARLQQRLAEYGGDAQKAFANLEENPIWLNKQKGIAVKRVTITGVNNAVALHDKRDKDGQLILSASGARQPVDYVSTSNNHHVAIFRDEKGVLQEHIVSFYEAVEAARQGLPVIDRSYNANLGWEFLFTMKQNEYFVFPQTENYMNDKGEENERVVFNPKEIDLLDPKNYAIISKRLYRVQKFATKDYVFRHHLETTVEDDKSLKNIAWIRCGLSGVAGIVKVRVNHIGQIVAVGEY